MNTSSSDFRYNDKESFFRLSFLDSNMLNLGTINDAKYQAAYDSLRQVNIGRFQESANFIQNAYYDSAFQRLNNITPENDKEGSKKFVLLVICNYYAYDSIPDSATTDYLYTIANMHPFYGGDAVYIARAFLHINIVDQMPAQRIMHLLQAINGVRKNNSMGLLYPNPARDRATCYYPHDDKSKFKISITDMLGKTIDTYDLKTNSITFRTANYLPGIYNVHIYQDSKKKEVHKLTIVR